MLWNLLPVDTWKYATKSKGLPRLGIYLQPFAEAHKKVIKSAYYNNHKNKLLEDYLVIYDSLYELGELSSEDFYSIYKKTFSPLVQIADNMGFTYW